MVSQEALVTTALRMKLNGFTLRMPVEPTQATLEGHIDENGLILFNAFLLQDDHFPPAEKPLDPMEAWLSGRLNNGVFTADEAFRRIARHPDLPPMALLQPGEGEPAVVCLDAAGRAHAYTWR